MVKRFYSYTQKAIANYKSRCDRLKKGIEIAVQNGNEESAKKYRKLLFKQRAMLLALFVYFFFCLLVIFIGG